MKIHVNGGEFHHFDHSNVRNEGLNRYEDIDKKTVSVDINEAVAAVEANGIELQVTRCTCVVDPQ